MRNSSGEYEVMKINQIVLWLKGHSLLALLAAATVFTVCWLMKLRQRLRIKAPVVLLLSVLHVVYGVLCVRLFAMMEGSREGMSLYGAVFLMPIAYFFGAKVFKRSLSDVFDIFAICMIATLLFARVNCLCKGCCYGRLIAAGSTLRWPTREIEIIYYLVFLLYFIPKVHKGTTSGTVYPFYMLTYGALRFILEFFRESSYGKVIDLSHIWSLLSIAAGAAIYSTLRNEKKEKKKQS